MRNDVFTLPDNFGIAAGDTAIHYYSNNQSSVKNKVVFTQNVCCLLLQGVKEVYTASGKETITDRDLLLFGGGSVLMSETTTTDGHYEALLLFFSNKTLLDACAHNNWPTATAIQTSPLLKLSRDAFLDNFCHSLQLLQSTRNTALHALKVQELLSYLGTVYPDVLQQMLNRAQANDQELQFRQIVDSNAAKGLSLAEMAFLCHMSVSTFKRHFTKNYGLPPQQYFTKLKMDRARAMLAAQQRPSDIYEELGYEHLAAFSNEFKKHTGITPGHFRQRFEPIAQASEPMA